MGGMRVFKLFFNTMTKIRRNEKVKKARSDRQQHVVEI